MSNFCYCPISHSNGNTSGTLLPECVQNFFFKLACKINPKLVEKYDKPSMRLVIMNDVEIRTKDYRTFVFDTVELKVSCRDKYYDTFVIIESFRNACEIVGNEFTYEEIRTNISEVMNKITNWHGLKDMLGGNITLYTALVFPKSDAFVYNKKGLCNG